MLGVALLLLGAGAAASRLVPSWLGVLLVVAGLLSLIAGFSVGYVGFQSAFQDAVVVGFQLVMLAFAVGLLVVSRQARGPDNRRAGT